MIGVDYASVDGNNPPQWAITKRDVPGFSFAIVRGSWGQMIDPHMRRDWAGIKAAGLTRGAYLFLRFDAEAGSPVEQARAFCDAIKLEPGDFPPWLDVEFPGGGTKTGQTPQQLLMGVLEAWRVMRCHYGVVPGIYTSARVWRDDFNNAPLTGDLAEMFESPLWLAGPWPWQERTKAQLGGAPAFAPKVPPPWGSQWFVYQYQGDARGCPGFARGKAEGQTDMNRFRVFGKNAKGDHVKWVQRRLGELYQGKLDGDFGPKTEGAVIDFQKLVPQTGRPDGFVGPKTFSWLCWREAFEN